MAYSPDKNPSPKMLRDQKKKKLYRAAKRMKRLPTTQAVKRPKY